MIQTAKQPKPALPGRLPCEVLPVPALITTPDDADRHGWARAALASMAHVDGMPVHARRWGPLIAICVIAWLGIAAAVVAGASRDRGSETQTLELRP